MATRENDSRVFGLVPARGAHPVSATSLDLEPPAGGYTTSPPWCKLVSTTFPGNLHLHSAEEVITLEQSDAPGGVFEQKKANGSALSRCAVEVLSSHGGRGAVAEVSGATRGSYLSDAGNVVNVVFECVHVIDEGATMDFPDVPRQPNLCRLRGAYSAETGADLTFLLSEQVRNTELFAPRGVDGHYGEIFDIAMILTREDASGTMGAQFIFLQLYPLQHVVGMPLWDARLRPFLSTLTGGREECFRMHTSPAGGSKGHQVGLDELQSLADFEQMNTQSGAPPQGCDGDYVRGHRIGKEYATTAEPSSTSASCRANARGHAPAEIRTTNPETGGGGSCLHYDLVSIMEKQEGKRRLTLFERHSYKKRPTPSDHDPYILIMTIANASRRSHRLFCLQDNRIEAGPLGSVIVPAGTNYSVWIFVPGERLLQRQHEDRDAIALGVHDAAAGCDCEADEERSAAAVVGCRRIDLDVLSFALWGDGIDGDDAFRAFRSLHSFTGEVEHGVFQGVKSDPTFGEYMLFEEYPRGRFEEDPPILTDRDIKVWIFRRPVSDSEISNPFPDRLRELALRQYLQQQQKFYRVSTPDEDEDLQIAAFRFVIATEFSPAEVVEYGMLCEEDLEEIRDAGDGHVIAEKLRALQDTDFELFC